MKKVALFPVIGPDLVYGKDGRSNSVNTFIEESKAQGYALDGKSNRLIYPTYVDRIGTFIDCTTEASELMNDGYKLKLSFGGLMPDPVMIDRLMGQRLLALPIVSKGSMMDERVRDKFIEKFDSVGFNYVSDVNYKTFQKYGRIFLNPVAHDRVSYKLFSLNVVLAAKYGYRIYAVAV